MKKYFVLLTLCFSVCSFAQIVNIPDANFKTKLIALGVDTNNNAEIEVSEALAITNLDVSSSSISDLSGIESFTNLINFDCHSNQITFLNINSLVNLQVLNANDNLLSTFSILGLSNLTHLSLSINNLSSLDASGLFNLLVLNCSDNLIASLNVSGLTNLIELNCSNNKLVSIDLSNLDNLQRLICAGNHLDTINVINLSNLDRLHCDNNGLTSLDLSGLSLLFEVNCSNNLITSINLSGLESLNNFYCSSNELTTLDFSNIPDLFILECQNNQLETLFLKNGKVENTLVFSDNPNLTYICADEDQVASIQTMAATNVVVNSYCSFTPGGNFNTINGTIKFDQVGDGCDATDNILPFVRFEMQSPTNQVEFSSNAVGEYAAYAMLGEYVVTPIIENPSWFTITPENATVTFDNTDNNFVTQNFCITPTDIHSDAAIVITPLNQPVPNTNVTYQIVFRNKGTQPLFGVISLNYDDGALDYVDSSIFPDNQVGGQLDWNYIELLPFETRTFLVTFNVGQAVPIDYVLQLTSQISTSLTDEIPLDNQFLYKHKVVSFSNSNTITCLQGEIAPVTLIGEYLDYAVDFENTGLAPIENAVIKFQINPTMFDANSIQIQEATDTAFLRKNGNVVEVILQQVNIDTGGHGNVLLKIKSQPTLQEGDSVINVASIYFDYNAPIITNEAETTFKILNNPSFQSDESITVFPNPTASIININCNNTVKKVELYDVQGRLLQIQMVDSTTTSLDISSKTSGIYFAKITSEKGVKVEKISKE